MWRHLVTMLLIAWPSLVWAGDHGSSSDAKFDCHEYNSNPWMCTHRAGCRYDQMRGECNPIEPNGVNQCLRFGSDREQCEEAGCTYNWQTGWCLDPFNVGRYICTAVDTAFEGHEGGHQGGGRSQMDAEQQALFACRQFHENCQLMGCQIQ